MLLSGLIVNLICCTHLRAYKVLSNSIYNRRRTPDDEGFSGRSRSRLPLPGAAGARAAGWVCNY
eukprot:4085076-Pyramimonas_sp.AAC.1